MLLFGRVCTCRALFCCTHTHVAHLYVQAMMRMNRQMNIPAMQRIMMEFEKQSEMMDMKEEMMSDTMDDVFGEDQEEEEVCVPEACVCRLCMRVLVVSCRACALCCSFMLPKFLMLLSSCLSLLVRLHTCSLRRLSIKFLTRLALTCPANLPMPQHRALQQPHLQRTQQLMIWKHDWQTCASERAMLFIRLVHVRWGHFNVCVVNSV